MAGTIMNPPTPFVGNLPGNLSNGKSIVINGFAIPHEERFAINLACGGRLEPREDTALHFNARFDRSCVVRNSLKTGNWGTEECHGSFPFRMGVPFQVVIDVNSDYYKISVDGHHFCDFLHRIPLQRVNTITVEKGIQINFVRYDGFPGGFPAGGAYNPPPVAASCFPAGGIPGYPDESQPIYNPHVPFTVPIPGGISQGKMISISGRPNPSAKRFTINLCCGSGSEDIPFHFDVRFDHIYKKEVVRSHRVNNQYGPEERKIPHFPFIPSTNFDILILCEAAGFKVAVNNQHFIEFAHRIMPPNRIKTLEVKGDVQLTLVRFQ
ncbi:hypothetical protein ScPMuIL_014952 [Solemya velum]